MSKITENNMSDDLKSCEEFHGHLCPGLVYGYRVSKEAIRLLDICRASDEEIVTICENDSCAVDGFQKLLGTTVGKGNLVIKDYGKNAYTVFSQTLEKLTGSHEPQLTNTRGSAPEEFLILEQAMEEKTATHTQIKRHKLLKSLDLASKPFDEIFETKEVKYNEPPYAALAPSCACAICREMTMETKMVKTADNLVLCIPCSEKR